MARTLGNIGWSSMRRRSKDEPSVLQAHLLSDLKRFCDSRLEDDATLIVIAAEHVDATVS